MKILVAHELYPPDASGGGEMLMHRLSKGLVERGHDVTVLTSGNPSVKEFEGVKTIRIPINRYAMNLALPSVLKYCKDADVIQTVTGNMTIPVHIAAKMLNKPICCLILLHLGSYWEITRGPLVGTFFELFEKLYTERKFDAITVMNKMMKKWIEKLTGEKTVLLQPGIDHNKFKKYRKMKKEGFVLFVGNFAMNRAMVKLKGLGDIIDAAGQLPDTKFIVVGEGEGLRELEKSATPNVEFKGKVVGDPLIKLYSKASIFCHPSLSESFSFVTAEAMSAGCAVLSTIDLGQTGKILVPMSSQDIIDSIKFYKSHPEAALRDGMKNRRIAERAFRWDRYVEGYEKIYKEISKS